MILLTPERQGFINRLLRDPVGSRIIESVVRVASDETIQTLFMTYFKETLSDLAMDSSANFVVQRVIGRLTESEDVTFVVKKLLPLTSKLIGNKFHTSKFNNRKLKSFSGNGSD